MNYFQENLGVGHIPNFLKASSPKGLQSLMLKNNIIHKGFVNYFNIQYVESEKSWYAWFFITKDNSEILKENLTASE